VNNNRKSLENWIWDAACSIRGAKDAAKYKEFIMPLIFTKRLCGVGEDMQSALSCYDGQHRPMASVMYSPLAGLGDFLLHSPK